MCDGAEVVSYLFLILGWNATLYPQRCGRLYFPIFLFKVGLFNLVYMASLIVLAILRPFLPMIMKFLTDVVWQVLFWCSKEIWSTGSL